MSLVDQEDQTKGLVRKNKIHDYNEGRRTRRKLWWKIDVVSVFAQFRRPTLTINLCKITHINNLFVEEISFRLHKTIFLWEIYGTILDQTNPNSFSRFHGQRKRSWTAHIFWNGANTLILHYTQEFKQTKTNKYTSKIYSSCMSCSQCYSFFWVIMDSQHDVLHASKYIVSQTNTSTSKLAMKDNKIWLPPITCQKSTCNMELLEDANMINSTRNDITLH